MGVNQKPDYLQIVSTKTRTRHAPVLSSIGDIAGVKDAIMAKLGPLLSLTEKQKPAITGAIEGFLKNKASIASLASTNAAAYKSKASTLKSGLFSNIKKSVTSGQYAKFLKLKPKTQSAANVLSTLFY